MKAQNKKKSGAGESEASGLERDDRNELTHGPGSPAGNHEGSPMGSRGDNKSHHLEKKEMGGSRTSKK